MNIVFAFADDWGRYASVYKKFEGENSVNSVFTTPNIDKIAYEGVTFKNAIVPAPSCTPCRSSLCSGQYFWQTGLGAILTGATWDESIATFPLELEKNGYHIGFTYKVWCPGSNPDAPYGGPRNAYMKHGNLFGGFSQNVTKMSKEMSVEEAKKVILDEVRGNFQDFINKRKKNQNFCYWWGPTNTHRLWEKGSGKALWGIEPEDLKGKMPASLPDVPEIREDFADYLGEALAFDAGIGVLVDELEKMGELDDTLFVISGDHGIPGMPRGKCNLYNLGDEVALIARYPSKIKAGRHVDDLVNIMDLAPTFLDMAEVEIPKSMVAKSLKNILLSENSGQIEEDRTFVVTGRERHVDSAREGYLPYPQRAIHTEKFLYIINFEPDRWPMGEPNGLEDPEFQIPYELLSTNTFAAFADFDASPTKAWMAWHRNDEQHKHLYDLAVGKRPYEELFNLETDKDAMINVADDPKYAKIKAELRNKLLEELTKQNDPRIVQEDCQYEHLPYTSKETERWVNPK